MSSRAHRQYLSAPPETIDDDRLVIELDLVPAPGHRRPSSRPRRPARRAAMDRAGFTPAAHRRRSARRHREPAPDQLSEVRRLPPTVAASAAESAVSGVTPAVALTPAR
jgi:hypothetical protein